MVCIKYILDVLTSSTVPLVDSNPPVRGGSRPLCPVSNKLDGVQSTTVDKVDAGTLDRCQGSLVFPLHVKQQLSECRPCSHI